MRTMHERCQDLYIEHYKLVSEIKEYINRRNAYKLES